jgi:glycosyltransferase involved in cell wall biosynthesis
MKQLGAYPMVSVVICTLDEEDSLPHVLRQIPGWVDEVVLVDGRSEDRTVEVAHRAYPGIRVVYQPGKGKGDALRHGIQNANGDIIVTLDADGETNPADMELFVQPLLEGCDFAKGSRFLNGHKNHRPRHRLFGNRVITSVFNILFSKQYTDLCSGYNAFWKASIVKIDPWPADGYENEPFINCRAAKRGLKIAEISHADGMRIGGRTKEESWRQGLKAVKTIVRERFRG